MSYDQYRKEMKDNYNFTDVFIEAQIAYMVNHPEEQHRAEERLNERAEAEGHRIDRNT